ncbi:MAG: ATP-binding protein [Chryseolinea sp.]
MKISSLILSGFFLILALFSFTTYINYLQSDKINDTSEKTAVSTTIIRQSNRFQRNILSMVSGLRGYLLTNESSFNQSYDSAVVENSEILHELSGLVAENTAQKALLSDIETLHLRWVHEFSEPLVIAKEAALLSDSGAVRFSKLYREKLSANIEKDIQQGLQRKFKQFTNLEYNERDLQKNTLTASVEQTRRISFFLTVLSIIIGIGVALFLANFISAGMIKMINMANAIAGGNYSVQISGGGKDEVSRLTHSLNHMARTLEENISLLHRKNEELNQFAHIVSHDLKGPLRGIDNIVSWIDEDHNVDLTPKVKEYINLIKGRVVRVENLLNGILSYSRVGREVQPKETVNVNELIEEIKGYLPAKKNIIFEVQPNLPILFTERLPLFQIFLNLIGNAYKHHTHPQPKVKVYARSHVDTYEFFVSDNGPGIAPHYHEKIFVIFQTLSVGDSLESTGVGLAIVKKILTDRKLNIELTSEPGEGSIFAFTWPK